MSSDQGYYLATEQGHGVPVIEEKLLTRSPESRTDDSDIVVRVSNLSKCYLMYEKPQHRLKQFVVPRLQRLTGQVPRAYYREFWSLRDISFEVRKGDTLGIIGRNGAGKSTLLQILCGTVHPNSGTVDIKGRVAALLELGSGFNPEFTGRENVYVYARVFGLSRRQIDERFDDIATFADIGDFIDVPIKTYSSGMILRLAFSVVAHVDADILIIDEALAVGDGYFVQKCMRFLRNFMKTGTILFVSHDTGAVINLCQRSIWLEKGMIRANGSPKEVAELYLADLYRSKDGASATPSQTKTATTGASGAVTEPQDQRLTYLNRTQLKNNIELFHFDPSSPSFGKGGATILDVQLQDSNCQRLTWCVGGEDVILSVCCEAQIDIHNPIIGFYVKDRLGQPLFGDNTYLSYLTVPLSVSAGRRFEGRFCFRMPILPVGDYSICAAVAEGSQAEHVQHHWIHDAVIFRSHSSSVCTGLVGIPMRSIEFRSS